MLVDAPVPATFMSEALSEFVGRRALLRAGLIGRRQWAELVSAKLAKHAATLHAGPPPDGSDADDAYVEGDLVILLVDSEIRRRSQGRSDLLQLTDLLVLRSGGVDGAGKLRWTDFCRSLAELTSTSFASRVEDLVQGRGSIRVAEAMFAGCLRVVQSPVWEFDPGFDVESSIEQRRILGVRRGGSAWQAGLRDGDVLLEWDLRWGRADEVLRVEVLRRGAHRRFSYLPRGRLTPGARQELVPVPEATGCERVL